jgi:hypothetical protein
MIGLNKVILKEESPLSRPVALNLVSAGELKSVKGACEPLYAENIQNNVVMISLSGRRENGRYESRSMLNMGEMDTGVICRRSEEFSGDVCGRDEVGAEACMREMIDKIKTGAGDDKIFFVFGQNVSSASPVQNFFNHPLISHLIEQIAEPGNIEVYRLATEFGVDGSGNACNRNGETGHGGIKAELDPYIVSQYLEKNILTARDAASVYYDSRNVGAVDDLSISSEPKPFAKNLLYASEISNKVRAHFIYGTNTERDSIDPMWKRRQQAWLERHNTPLINSLRDDVVARFTNCRKNSQAKLSFEDFFKINQEAVLEYQYAQCGEIAAIAFVEAQSNPCISSVDFCRTSEGHHNLIVIGRKKDSDPDDISTWGDEAVVCDPWALKIYPVSLFSQMQAPEYDVKYPPRCYQGGPLPPPYLAGKLNVEHHWDRAPTT